MQEGRFPKLSGAPLTLGAVVTVSGTGSEMNAGGVITNEEKKIKTEGFSAFLPALPCSIPNIR